MSFEFTTLSDYARVQGGFAYKSTDFIQESKNRVIKIKNVRFGSVNYSDCAFISDNLAKATKLWKTSEGDILISMTGSGPNAPQSLVGRVARVWGNEPEAYINQRVGKIILEKGHLIHPDFVFYLLSLTKSQEFLVSNSSGSANQANISAKTVGLLPCPKITFKESSDIATILRTLDEKIILNQQTNQTLENMAQALFKSWFVDFDPVFDNALANGAQIQDFPEPLRVKAQKRQTMRDTLRNSDEYQALPDDILALFPSEFEESELGWIPKGWGVKTLSRLLEVKYGKDHKKLEAGTYPVYGSGGLMRTVERYLYEGESVLIPRKGTLTNIMYVKEAFWTVDTMFFTVPKQDNVAKFTFYFLKGLDITNMNVGSAVPSMTTKVLNALELICPCERVLAKFDEIIQIFFDKADFNKQNIIELQKLRDTLLPKLISGELSLDHIVTQINKDSL